MLILSKTYENSYFSYEVKQWKCTYIYTKFVHLLMKTYLIFSMLLFSKELDGFVYSVRLVRFFFPIWTLKSSK